MKGDTNIEFILSAGVFLIVVAFLSFHILSFVPIFHSESRANILKSKTFQVSEMLIMSTGSPQNWDESEVTINDMKKIGLTVGEDYVLDKNKIDKLQNWCNNYYRTVINLSNLDYRMSLIINMTDIDGNSIMLCAPEGISYKNKNWIYRFAIIDEDDNGIVDENDKIVKLKISVF
ncbi:MAG: hypothetical protein J7J92_02875 [Candidatus Aenigmarchaeota archaeon]|nr:hypothetical protein [Candidatus Aenigmarchaeota archaeon]